MIITISYPYVTYVGEVVSHQIAWGDLPIDLDQVLEILKTPAHGFMSMKDGTSLELHTLDFFKREKSLLTGTIVIRNHSLKREIHCDLRRAIRIVFDASTQPDANTAASRVRIPGHERLAV